MDKVDVDGLLRQDFPLHPQSHEDRVRGLAQGRRFSNIMII